MNNKKLNKFFCIIFSCIVLLSCPVTIIPVQAACSSFNTPTSNIETIQPRAAIIEWVYKEVDGKIYRRLYNFQTKEYIGDWILCK